MIRFSWQLYIGSLLFHWFVSPLIEAVKLIYVWRQTVVFFKRESWKCFGRDMASWIYMFLLSHGYFELNSFCRFWKQCQNLFTSGKNEISIHRDNIRDNSPCKLFPTKKPHFFSFSNAKQNGREPAWYRNIKQKEGKMLGIKTGRSPVKRRQTQHSCMYELY